MNRPSHRTAWALLFVIAVAASACSPPNMTELQSAKSGTLDIVLLSPREALRHGKDTFIIEFRSASGNLVDAGTVSGSASMSMSGMPMLGSIDVARTEVAGRYAAASEFSMAGTWRLTIKWDGPAGQGSITFSGFVQ